MGWRILLAGALALSAAAARAETKRNYAGVKAALEKIHAEHPAGTALFPLAQTDGKETVEGISVGSGPVKNLVVAAHHGNEYGSTEVALAFAESIAQNPLPGQTVYVIPVLNIDGYNHRQREERDAQGVYRDPNRDYPGPCGTEGPFRLKSTKALADFVEKEGIVSAATLHTYYPAVVYPWGISTRDLTTAYPELFRGLVGWATEESHYAVGNSTEVIYPADGAFEDFAFWKDGVWSILFELGYSHSPSDNEVREMIRVNVPGMRRMLANAPKARAADHAFTGRCDFRLRSLDRHDE
jgi:hypothetical protein